jgi:plastocyanin
MLRNMQAEGSRRGGSRTRQLARFLGFTGLGFGVLALFWLFAPSDHAECARAAAQVRISPLFGFIPSSLTVKSGNTVTWVNDGEFPHTVTSPEGAFASQAIQREKAFSFRFDAPGTSRTSPASSLRLPAELLFAEEANLGSLETACQ